MPDIILKLVKYLAEHSMMGILCLALMGCAIGGVAVSHASQSDITHNVVQHTIKIDSLDDRAGRLEIQYRAIEAMLKETNENTRMLLKIQLEHK